MLHGNSERAKLIKASNEKYTFVSINWMSCLSSWLIMNR